MSYIQVGLPTPSMEDEAWLATKESKKRFPLPRVKGPIIRRDLMSAEQLARIDVLLTEKNQHLTDDNEYYAAMVDRDLWEASSLARLIHLARIKE